MTIKPKRHFAHRRYDNRRFDRHGGKYTKHASPSKERFRSDVHDDIFVTRGIFQGRYGKYIKNKGGINDLKIVVKFPGEQMYHYITSSFVVACEYRLMNPNYNTSSVGTHGFKIERGIVNCEVPGIVLDRDRNNVNSFVRFADGTSNQHSCLDFVDFHPFHIVTKGRGPRRQLL